MSNAAVGYVLRATVGDSTRKVILIAMADSANSQTGVMWHGVTALATMAECSPRTVQRHLRVLITEGYVRKGDQSYVAHLRGDRRPTVYEVATSDRQRADWAQK